MVTDRAAIPRDEINVAAGFPVATSMYGRPRTGPLDEKRYVWHQQGD